MRNLYDGRRSRGNGLRSSVVVRHTMRDTRQRSNMPEGDSTRDRVRALVREVLKNAAPADEPDEREPSRAATREQPTASAEAHERARVVNVAPSDSREAPARDYTHDESSKTVITEDDVRSLPEGARLRVAEGARLTPLASDIVRERRVVLVRRAPRRGARAEKIVAVGA